MTPPIPPQRGEETVTIGKICFHHDSGISWAQWEGAGWSVRFGSHLWSVFHADYRDRNPWPKWARFCLVLRKPRGGVNV